VTTAATRAIAVTYTLFIHHKMASVFRNVARRGYATATQSVKVGQNQGQGYGREEAGNRNYG
jgi:hypothetical protein